MELKIFYVQVRVAYACIYSKLCVYIGIYIYIYMSSLYFCGFDLAASYLSCLAVKRPRPKKKRPAAKSKTCSTEVWFAESVWAKLTLALRQVPWAHAFWPPCKAFKMSFFERERTLLKLAMGDGNKVQTPNSGNESSSKHFHTKLESIQKPRLSQWRLHDLRLEHMVPILFFHPALSAFNRVGGLLPFNVSRAQRPKPVPTSVK